MGIFVFVIISLSLAFAGGLLYLLYLPLRYYLIRTGRLSQRRSHQITTFYWLGILLLSVCLTLVGLYPSERFYREEFETVTLRELPESAVFISKEASYPDFHGDYASSAQIKLSKADYTQLLEELQNDKRMIANGESIGFQEFDHVLGSKKEDGIIYSFTRAIPGEEDHYQYIGFYNDGQTIFVNIVVT